MDQLSLAVMSRSSKKDERRLPIHPRHIERIDADLRSSIFLESGYGECFWRRSIQRTLNVATVIANAHHA